MFTFHDGVARRSAEGGSPSRETRIADPRRFWHGPGDSREPVTQIYQDQGRSGAGESTEVKVKIT